MKLKKLATIVCAGLMISPLLGTVEFDAIISNNDAMALGAIEALHAQGMDPKDYIIVGVDATVDGCTAVEEVTAENVADYQ